MEPAWGVCTFCSVHIDSSVKLVLAPFKAQKLAAFQELQAGMADMAARLDSAIDRRSAVELLGSEAFSAILARTKKVPKRIRTQRLQDTYRQLNTAIDAAFDRADAPAPILERPVPRPLDPTGRMLLLGSCDASSPLALLSGQSDVLRLVFEATRFAREAAVCAAALAASREHGAVVLCRGCHFPERQLWDRPPTPAELARAADDDDGTLWAPTDAAVRVNMLPFVMGDVDSLPPACREYHPLVAQCLKCLPATAAQQVGYLTVDEGWVEAGKSQRRRGAHTDGFAVEACVGRGSGASVGRLLEKPIFHPWGRGSLISAGRVEGGIFMASDVGGTTAVWDCVLPPEVIGAGGDVEHLRGLLQGAGHATRLTLGCGELLWMTDRAPHESLPLRQRAYRRFFRLVAGPIDVWYARHSTPNPMGCEPDAAAIARYDKFTGE